ncbi:hypothetical protein [Streptomyces sp. JJ38]|uniref:hypothetical protein n=1 Tax=Streptomyces sp. JJ38 TaxID=2738128 RepID=UPI001C57B70F|nr:hypothetical protein [Streptomyces sp. JJ38]
MNGIFEITPGNTNALTTARSVVATCSLGGSLLATGLSGVRVGDERPTKASAAVAGARATAHAFTAAVAGAGERRQKTLYIKHHTMWAFRGPEPWRDPA